MELNTFNIFSGWMISNNINSPNQFFFVDLEEFDFVMKKDIEILVEIIRTIDALEIVFMFTLSVVLVMIFVRIIRGIKIISGLHEQK